MISLGGGGERRNYRLANSGGEQSQAHVHMTILKSVGRAKDHMGGASTRLPHSLLNIAL